MIIAIALLAIDPPPDLPAIVDVPPLGSRAPVNGKPTNPSFYELSAKMKAHCSGEWPADFRMQAYCYKLNLIGYQDTANIAKQFGEPMLPAIQKCLRDWTKAGLTNWRMVGYCSKLQADGYSKLNH